MTNTTTNGCSNTQGEDAFDHQSWSLKFAEDLRNESRQTLARPRVISAAMQAEMDKLDPADNWLKPASRRKEVEGDGEVEAEDDGMCCSEKG